VEGGRLMNVKYLLFLFISLTSLTACSIQDSSKHTVQQDTPVKETQKEKPNKQQVEKKSNENQTQLVNELVNLLKQKKYLDVINKTMHGESDLEQMFFNFALAKQSVEKKHYADAYEFINKIENPPKEVPKEIIDEYQKMKKDLEKYKPIEYDEEMIRNEPVQKFPQVTDLEIGMTKEEVLEIFGKPKNINRTITANSVSEQWVYSDDIYLYFNDGILTAIQD
jgi:hypothetical protein